MRWWARTKGPSGDAPAPADNGGLPSTASGGGRGTPGGKTTLNGGACGGAVVELSLLALRSAVAVRRPSGDSDSDAIACCNIDGIAKRLEQIWWWVFLFILGSATADKSRLHRLDVCVCV